MVYRDITVRVLVYRINIHTMWQILNAKPLFFLIVYDIELFVYTVA